jgi:hypothetical protein
MVLVQSAIAQTIVNRDVEIESMLKEVSADSLKMNIV